jgi:hypothetical protein
MVQMRTRVMNQLQAVALNEGMRCKKRLENLSHGALNRAKQVERIQV